MKSEEFHIYSSRDKSQSLHADDYHNDMNDKDCMDIHFIGSVKISIDKILQELVLVNSMTKGNPNSENEFSIEYPIIHDPDRVEKLK